MALPPVPPGYLNWNDYINQNAPALAAAQGLTLMEAKCALKLEDVAMPVRQAVGTNSYRIYNQFTTWDARAVAPTQGRPWREASFVDEGGIITESSEALFTEDDQWLITE
jgi:hypothetical protein